jgi:hypothetical protein
MGNRAVIVSADTTKENANQKIGIYVHWYGSREDVEEALSKAKELGIRTFEADNQYFWARFCQIFANMLSGYETGIGIGIVSHLDCHNYDNGVYYINKDFEIEKQTTGEELE